MSFTFSLLLPTLALSSPLTLHSPTHTFTLDPATLSVTSDDLPLSSPQPDLPSVSGLTSTATSATWTYPSRGLSVTATLANDTLSLRFTSDRPGTVTFPSLPARSRATALLLPLGEGAYIPTDDPDWSAHLAAISPLDTTADLSMPFVGLLTPDHAVTYLLTNPFGNQLTFHTDSPATLTHTFLANWPVKQFEVLVSLGPPHPLEPARRYRQHLIATKQFVSLKDKIAATPDAAKLIGAPHVYLWGGDRLTPADVKDFKSFAKELLADNPTLTKLSPETQQLLRTLPATPYVDNYTKSQITHELSTLLSSDSSFTLPPSSFPSLAPADTWGDGISAKMIRRLKSSGLDRLRICISDADDLRHNPAAVTAAVDAGYLIGPYDSYHSIHPPGLADTWATAQFPDDPALYDRGAIRKPDGSPLKGFKGKGHLLSPLAARPFVERRVGSWLHDFPAANLWFVDCDAFGQLYDDFSPDHPATQLDDMNARLARLAWLRDAHHLVVGSEGGSSYAAPALHFAEGVDTGGFGWGDPDLHSDKSSPYYLGRYYPPSAPEVFLKPVPLKPAYYKFYADPRYRLPLYQAALHDSLVTTHHWSAASLKFSDQAQTRALLELLCAVPPLYHLAPAEFAKRKDAILAHYAVFSPLHRATATTALTDFAHLTPDHLVHRTTFSDGTTVTANFSDHPHDSLPPHSARIEIPNTPTLTYTP